MARRLKPLFKVREKRKVSLKEAQRKSMPKPKFGKKLAVPLPKAMRAPVSVYVCAHDWNFGLGFVPVTFYPTVDALVTEHGLDDGGVVCVRISQGVAVSKEIIAKTRKKK